MRLSKPASHDFAFARVRRAPCHTALAHDFVNSVALVVDFFFALNPHFFPQLVNGDIERQEYFQLCKRNKWFCRMVANAT